MNHHHPPEQVRPGDHIAEPLGPEKVHLFDKPENVRNLFRAFYAISALLLLADFVIHRHIEHPWERLPGFHAIYGFLGVALLVFGAKLLRRVVMRPEGYYEDA